jgi:hypothetical protein
MSNALKATHSKYKHIKNIIMKQNLELGRKQNLTGARSRISYYNGFPTSNILSSYNGTRA